MPNALAIQPLRTLRITPRNRIEQLLVLPNRGFHAPRQQRGAAARQAQAVLDAEDLLRQRDAAAALHEHAPERQRLIEIRADIALLRARGQLLHSLLQPL